LWFSHWTGAGDVVHGWGEATGNQDRLFVNVKTFRGGLVAGEDLGTKLVSLASSAPALEGADRFIFRQSDETLGFDKDGKGGVAGLMIADFQDGAVVTAAEVILSF
jgi:hypothetical protein